MGLSRNDSSIGSSSSGRCASVTCDVQHRGWGGEIGSYARLQLRFEAGVLFGIELGNLARFERPRWLILGERGSFVKYGLDPQERAMLSGAIDAEAEEPGIRARGASELHRVTARIRDWGGEAHALPADIADKRAPHRIAGAAAGTALGPCRVPTDGSALGLDMEPAWGQAWHGAVRLAGYDSAPDLDVLLDPDLPSWHPLSQAQYLEVRTFLTPYLLSSQGDRAKARQVITDLDARLRDLKRQLKREQDI